ncbi:MAG: protease inhibitor I42 family protein [Oscillospiraceae bacterium]|jgi:predicted secreted protein|nr:protease inhibitor I42 family protein [Oscillospiraceae bacterium]
MLKKSISGLLCAATALVLPFATVTARAETGLPESTFSPSYILGDIDGDVTVTAADARLCLRASAKLQTLTQEQQQAADVFSDGEITAANARKILRVSAKLERFEVLLKVGQAYVLPPLRSAGSGMYQWNYSVSPSIGIGVKEETVFPWEDTDLIGAPSETTYTFLAQNPGTYTVTLQLKASWETAPINEISFIIKVMDVVIKQSSQISVINS